MVVEKLIKEKGTIQVRLSTPVYEGGEYIGYRHTGEVDVNHYEWRYFYDGFEFVGGDFGMTELITHFKAVMPDDIRGKITPDKAIKKFKEKLAVSGNSLGVVIRTNLLRNLDLGTWLVNSLII